MKTERIKRGLLRVLGERGTAWIQAVRFVYLIRTGRYRDAEVDLLPLLLRDGDVAVDVGANGANWTYYNRLLLTADKMRAVLPRRPQLVHSEAKPDCEP